MKYFVVKGTFFRCTTNLKEEKNKQLARWWFQIFCYFSPRKLGKINPILTCAYFSDGDWWKTTNPEKFSSARCALGTAARRQVVCSHFCPLDFPNVRPKVSVGGTNQKKWSKFQAQILEEVMLDSCCTERWRGADFPWTEKDYSWLATSRFLPIPH